MTELPAFIRNAANRIARSSQYTADIEGYLYDGADGSQVALWTCHTNATSERHVHAFDEYVVVLAGRCTVVLDDRRIELSPGEDLHVPAGTHQSVEVTAGTRTMHVFGGDRCRRELAIAPQGWPRVIPRIVAVNARELVAFVVQLFDATGEHREDRPAEMRIGGSMILISDAGERSPINAFLYVYVEDADATHRRALALGARSLEAPSDLPYGDRRCMIEDPWGNTWQIATRRP